MKNSARIHRVFKERLSRLSLAKHPALMYSPNIEGYRDYTFGGRAGPAIQLVNLFHELGHAAQFGPEAFRTRASPEGFKFKVRRIEVCGQICVEPETGQSTERELDTFAHQFHLMQSAGYRKDLNSFSEECSSIMRFMPDWYHIEGGTGAARKDTCARRIVELYGNLSQKAVLEKLEAWLDATRARLNRQKLQKRPWHLVEVRLRPLLDPVTTQTRL